MTTATISATQVKELREKTGVGMMLCKKALTECDGDMEKAVDQLRKQGEAVAAKRADKIASEGAVLLESAEGKAIIAELNCETDFVSGGDDFKALSSFVMSALKENEVKTLEELKAAKAGDLDIEGRLNEIRAKIGENIDIRRFEVLSVGVNDSMALYSHLGGKIGVVLKLTASGAVSDPAVLEALGKDLAMQVAAFNPQAIDESAIDEVSIAKEREIYRDQALQQGTKEEFVDRVVDGRLKKFFKEVCLVHQMFVKDNKKSVQELLAETAKAQGLESLEVASFVRFELGK